MKEKKIFPKDKKKLLPLLLFLLLITLIVYVILDSQKDDSKNTSDIERVTDKVELTNFKDTLPDNYPKDLPQYEEAEITSASATDSSVSVMWRTEDLVEDVKKYYDLELKNYDWNYELTQTDGVFMYKLNKNEKTGFMIIASESGITTITIAVGLE
jgi:hypothetical protein